ncbi:MAG TPA: hypothetical protein VFH63_03870 [candidate division Zixibacteria bacterium]|nr:hypothetical protein [candidate division Zixibacteria bacterium]
MCAELSVALLPPAQAQALTTTRVSQRYQLTATLEVDAGRLVVDETIIVTNRAAYPIDHLNLSVLPRAFGFITFTGDVTVDGAPAETAWTTTTNLRVTLPEPLPQHRSVTIRIPFRLDVGSAGGAFTARLSRDRGVLSFGHWFPILSREHDGYAVGDPQVTWNADAIRLDLTTTTPLPRDAVACAGLVEAPETSGSHWSCLTGNVRDMSFVVNPAFRMTERRVGLVRLKVYTQTVEPDRTADMAASALERMSQAFGRYPWPDLVMAEVGASDGFSMEYPRMVHLTRSKVADPYVVNHEVAHMWFYAQLGNDQMLEPWLDEGWADWATRWLLNRGESQCSGRPIDTPVFAWPAGLTRGGDWQSCDGYFHTVFYKTSEFLNRVRARMGDEAFFGAMRDFIAEHRYGVVTSDQLLLHLERRSAADLEPLYRAYLGTWEPMQPAPKPRRPLERAL